MPRLDAIPRRIVDLRLAAPYDVFKLKVWVSFPRALLERPTREFLAAIVVESDIEGEDGKPIPLGTPEFFDALPPDLANAITSATYREIGNLPPVSSATSRSG